MLPVYAQTTVGEGEKATELETIVIKGAGVGKDRRGHRKVYSQDTVNLYRGKEEIETFRGSSVADLLQGLAGVHSGDARNSGAVDPNIRGVQGEGRIPVSIDGTEQAITVWRGYAGVNNRNYVDPNLISSVTVEKGPSFNPAARNGIGGNIAMKTLEVEDILEPDQTWGVEVKGELGNNAINPLQNPYAESRHYLDYNSINGFGGTWRAILDGSELRPQRFDGGHRFNADKAFRIAAAARGERVEGLLAYAYRNKGNYFSGKNGAHRYGYQEGLSLENIAERVPPASSLNDPYIARIGLFVKPGSEISNTSLETKSYLAKGSIRPTDNSKVSLGYRYTDSRFGDIMPLRILGPMMDSARKGRLYNSIDWPQASVKQHAVNLDWHWNPDSRWLDMRAGAWMTRTRSTTNTSGGYPGDVYYYESDLMDAFHLKATYDACVSGADDYAACGSYDPITSPQQAHDFFISDNPGFDPNKNYSAADAQYPNTDGRFNSVQGQAYHSRNNRYGFYLSNQMRLHDKLNLTLYGNLQEERLHSTTEYDSVVDASTRKIAPHEEGKVAWNSIYDFAALPRRGQRREGSFSFNFQFKPTNWLELNAGARYSSYSMQDHNVDRLLKEGVHATRNVNIDRGVYYTARQVATPEQYALYLRGQRGWDEFNRTIDGNLEDLINSGLITQQEYNALQMIEMGEVGGRPVPYIPSLGTEGQYALHQIPSLNFKDPGSEPTYFIPLSETQNVTPWLRDEYGRLDLSKNPLLNGTLNPNEKVVNPADPNGPLVDKYPKNDDGSSPFVEVPIVDGHNEAEKQRARRHSGAGWAPFASATVRLGDYARVYARYHEFKRWPSMFEGTLGFSSGGAISGSGATSRYGYYWKPEHAKIWEIGYVHDLTGLLPSARYADFRIGYFRNTTRNIVDRDDLYNLIQFDKQIRDGIELQTRFDFGRVFGDLGVVRSMRNKVCDATYAYWASNDKRRLLPTCLNGSMAESSYLGTMIQPRWSVSANLGARFLDNKLTVGTRLTYHSRAYDTRTASLIKAGWTEARGGAESFNIRWQPVLVVDAYLRYRFNKHISAELTGSNLGNRYYLDPMSRSYMPAPGRTIRLGVTAKF